MYIIYVLNDTLYYKNKVKFILSINMYKVNKFTVNVN